MKAASPHFNKAVTAFFAAGVIALILNYAGSLFFNDKLSLNWPIIMIAAILAGLCAYLSSLRKQVAQLEERVRELERKVR